MPEYTQTIRAARPRPGRLPAPIKHIYMAMAICMHMAMGPGSRGRFGRWPKPREEPTIQKLRLALAGARRYPTIPTVRIRTYVPPRARACACAVGCVLDNSACSRDGTARLQGPEAAGNCQPPANCSITEIGNIPRPMATHGRRSSAAVALIPKQQFSSPALQCQSR